MNAVIGSPTDPTKDDDLYVRSINYFICLYIKVYSHNTFRHLPISFMFCIHKIWEGDGMYNENQPLNGCYFHH